jgi:acetyltransferase-like isoleucine patch superfamily enzyme
VNILGSGYALCQLADRVKSKLFSVLISGAFRSFGAKSVIQPPARLSGLGAVSIGNRVFIGRNSWLIVVGNLSAEKKGISIGNGVSISGDCVISATESIIVEDDVLIGRYVHIADHRHGFEDSTKPIVAQEIAGVAPVRIKSGAWLGQGVVICPGVTIGRNAVIGANSVVRSDVPDNFLAAGIPAKIIRRVS